MKLNFLGCFLLLLLSQGGCVGGKSGASLPAAEDREAATDVITPAGLPSLGKWMLAPDAAPARWLNEIYYGKRLREPINIILRDHFATSATEATNRLLRALTTAGFPLRFGHSHGYTALIDGECHGQVTSGHFTAFSDEPFELTNNHGRIFGPHLYQGDYIWTAAFSRERLEPLAKVKHEYVSFNQARDTLALKLALMTNFKRVRFVALDNALLKNPTLTTGDHDGMAVLLDARE